MGAAGPRAAWVPALVATYWSKLAYMSDPKTVLIDLDAAQALGADWGTAPVAGSRSTTAVRERATSDSAAAQLPWWRGHAAVNITGVGGAAGSGVHLGQICLASGRCASCAVATT